MHLPVFPCDLILRVGNKLTVSLLMNSCSYCRDVLKIYKSFTYVVKQINNIFNLSTWLEIWWTKVIFIEDNEQWWWRIYVLNLSRETEWWKNVSKIILWIFLEKIQEWGDKLIKYGAAIRQTWLTKLAPLVFCMLWLNMA